jgi:outer membrane immunogenic protein
MMRISIAGAAAACLFATTAFAADLAPRTYTKAPPMIVEPGYNWTGFYAGINGGYSWGSATEMVSIGTPFPAFASKQHVDGGLVGGQIGYNWQVDPKWVLGLEADAQWTGERGSSDFFLGTLRGPTPGNDFNFVASTMRRNCRGLRPFVAGPASSPIRACCCTQPVVSRSAK